MKKYIFTALAAFLLTTAMQAQSFLTLNTSTDPSALALAGTSVARDADAFAVQNNASAMGLYEGKLALSGSYGMFQPKYLNQAAGSFAAMAKFGDKFAAGLFGNYFINQPYIEVSQVGAPNKEFTPKDLTAGLGFAYKVTDFLSVGLAGKFGSATFASDASSTAVCADLSVTYSQNGLNAAVSVNNLGPKAKVRQNQYDLPTMAKLGVSYSVASFCGSFEADYLFAGSFSAALGAEYTIVDIVSLRAGYHYGSGAYVLPSFASVGLGLKYADVELNAAYLLGSETLGGTMCFGLGYSF